MCLVFLRVNKEIPLSKTTIKKYATPLLSTIILSAFSSFAIAVERKLDSHEHGVSALKIAQDGSSFLFELEAPGDDIVGFEHEAKNDAQKAAVEEALSKLKNPEQLFVAPASAGCSVKENEAEFETSGDHAGFHVHWSMKCAKPANMKALKIKFFKVFEKASEIELEAVGEVGQIAVEVEKGQETVDMSGAFGG